MKETPKEWMHLFDSIIGFDDNPFGTDGYLGNEDCDLRFFLETDEDPGFGFVWKWTAQISPARAKPGFFMQRQSKHFLV